MGLLAVGDVAEVGEVGVQPPEVGAVEGVGARPVGLAPPPSEPRVHTVDDERLDPDVGLRELSGEEHGLVDGVAPR